MKLLAVFLSVALLCFPVVDAWVYRAIGAPPDLTYNDSMSLPKAVPEFSPLTGFATADAFGRVMLDFHPLAKGTPPVARARSGTQLYGKLVLMKDGNNPPPITPDDDVMIYIIEVGQDRPRVAQATTRAPVGVYTRLYGNRLHGKLLDGVLPSNEVRYDVEDEAWYFTTTAGSTDSLQQFHVFLEWDGLTRHHGTTIYAT